jgi:hypothetical protein
MGSFVSVLRLALQNEKQTKREGLNTHWTKELDLKTDADECSQRAQWRI